MKVRIKKLHSDAVVPRYAKPGDAGLDLTAVSMKLDSSSAGRELVTFGIGLAVEIPEGHVGLLFPRSSVYKSGLTLTNSVGVVDSGYRGEIMMKFQVSAVSNMYKVGDRVGQLLIVPYPQIEFDEVEELSSTERGQGGYGSTGA